MKQMSKENNKIYLYRITWVGWDDYRYAILTNEKHYSQREFRKLVVKYTKEFFELLLEHGNLCGFSEITWIDNKLCTWLGYVTDKLEKLGFKELNIDVDVLFGGYESITADYLSRKDMRQFKIIYGKDLFDKCAKRAEEVYKKIIEEIEKQKETKTRGEK